MYYAIIRQVGTSAEAEYTGMFYDYMNESIIKPHKEQKMFIEPMDKILDPINTKEIQEFEMKKVQAEMQDKMKEMMPSVDTKDDFDLPFDDTMVMPLSADIDPMPVYQKVTKQNAANAIKFYIDDMKAKMNRSDFTFDKGGTIYSFSASSDAINAVYTMCIGMTGSDPIPTTNGEWKGFKQDGTPEMIAFTVDEFKAMAQSLFDRNDANFVNRESHISAVMTMVSDDTKSITDILEYDYSGGWQGSVSQHNDIWY